MTEHASCAPFDLALRKTPRRSRRNFVRLTGFTLCFIALAAAAQQAGPQALIVSITLNGEPKGETIAYMSGRNNFLLKRQDFEEMAKVPADVELIEIDGELYVPLNSLPGATVKFDENILGLDITLPPEAFEKQVYSATGGQRQSEAPQQTATSALFNYRLAYAGSDSTAQGVWSLATEQAVTLQSWLLRNQSFHLRSPSQSSSVRFETQFVRDDRRNMRRLIAGDAFTAGAELGGSVQMGGLSLSKAYQLSPYFIRRPSANFSGSVALPSDVELYVGNTRFLRQSVSPGPFEIGGVNYYGGQRDVRVVIRDMFGREQIIDYPFYFADEGLAQGLHDYSYHAGVLRENFGVESDQYGEAAVSAFHKYGFSDSWTLGLRGEGTADYWNLGPSIVYRSNGFGVLSLNGAGSRDRAARRDGTALSLAHSYQAGDFSTFLALRQFSQAYAVLHSGTPLKLPRRDLNVALTYAPAGFGSLNLGYRQLALPGEPVTRSATLSYSKTVWRNVNLLGSYRHSFDAGSPDELFLTLLFAPGAGHTASTFVNTSGEHARSSGAQFSNTVPQGEGLAYRLNVQDNRDEFGSSSLLSPELNYFGRYGVASGELSSLKSSGQTSTAYTFALAGAAAAVGSRIGFSRPINDSFGMAEITPPVAGVRVYQNSQEIGRTGDNGRVFLPNLMSFADNDVSINDKDVPIDYTIERAARAVSPSFRSGSLIVFPVLRTQGFTGSLKYRAGKKQRPLEYYEVTLDADGKTVTFPTGRNGDFYLENLPPGRYAAKVQIGAKPCRFSLEIPESPETIVALNDVMTCNAAP